MYLTQQSNVMPSKIQCSDLKVWGGAVFKEVHELGEKCWREKQETDHMKQRHPQLLYVKQTLKNQPACSSTSILAALQWI